MALSEQDVDDLLRHAADAFGVPYPLLKAQAEHESNLNPLAARYEPLYRWTYPPSPTSGMPRFVRAVDPRVNNDATEEIFQKTSWGLLQVMGAVARELGFKGASLLSLANDPGLGLAYGVRYMKRMLDRYGKPEMALAAYNSGSPTNPAAADYVIAIMKRAAAIHDVEANEV